MPKAAVNKYSFAPATKQNIRPPRQTLSVEPVSVPQPVQQLPHNYFWFGILPSNAPHKEASF
jgi:hypothetical protein